MKTSASGQAGQRLCTSWQRYATLFAWAACILLSDFTTVAESSYLHLGFSDDWECRVWNSVLIVDVANTPRFGLGENDFFEIQRAVGDIDGDGYHDYAFSLYQWTWPFRSDPHLTDADGAILIEYGGPQRRGSFDPVQSGAPAPDETHLAEGAPDDGYPPLPEFYDTWPTSKLGALIACDDFDKDGFDDIVFSANSRDPAKRIAELCIYYGNSSDRGRIRYFENSRECPSLSRILLDDTAYGDDLDNDPFGYLSDAAYPFRFGDICTGDFNADTLPDIAVVAFRSWTAPEVVVIYGEPDFRGATRALSVPGDLTTSKIACESRRHRADVVGNPLTPDKGAPIRLARGDINGDGIDDLIIGDRTVDPDGIDVTFPWSEYWHWPYRHDDDAFGFGEPVGCTGAVYIVYGARNLPGTHVNLVTATPESGETVIRGEGWPNHLGFSLATGDVNQDGYDDLMLGGVTDLRWIEQGQANIYQFLGSPTKLGTAWGNGSLVDLKQSVAPVGAWGETRVAFHPRRFLDKALRDDESNGAKTPQSLIGDDALYADGIAYGDANGDGRDDFMFLNYRDRDSDADEGYERYFSIVATPNIAPGQRAFPAGFLDSELLKPGYLDVRNFSINLGPWTTLPSQDIDGDGNVDVDALGMRSVLTVFGEEGAPTAMAVERYTSGKTAMRGFGGSLSPVLRAYVGFEDGGPSAATVTLNKSRAGISNFPAGYSIPMDCYWRVQTDRAGYSKANLAFHYIDDDIPWPIHLPPVLLTAPSLSGPWTPVANQQLNARGRSITAQVSTLGYFTMAAEEVSDASVGPSVQEIACDPCASTVAGEDVLKVTFSHAVTGVDESDFSVTAPSTLGASILGVEGYNKTYRVRVALGHGVGPAVLEVLDDDTIRDQRGLPLGGPGADNGAAAGATCEEVFDPVLLESIARDFPSPSALPRLSYTVRFTMPVTGVDLDDFELTSEGLEGTHIESVAGSGPDYTVWVHSGEGVGNFRLKLSDNDSILDPGGGQLGGPGLNNGDFLGQQYRINRPPDQIPPLVSGITRASVSPTSAVSVDFYVEFTEDVTGVDESDLEVVTTGRISGAAITGIRGDLLVKIVTVSTGTGDGTIQLRLHDDDSIVDLAGNRLGGTGTGNGDYMNGAVYAIYKSDPTELPPYVRSITRLDASPTDSFSLHYDVLFSETVTGVTVDDFVTTTSGLYGSEPANVTGANDAYVVTVNTGNGSGTLRLDLRDNDSILDADLNPLGGIGNDNGHFTDGEYYQIVRDPVLQVKSLKKKQAADISQGSALKVKWTSGPVGTKVRVELWQNGRRVAVLDKKTKNDGIQKITIPGGVPNGDGYTIRVVAVNDSSMYSEMKRTFSIR